MTAARPVTPDILAERWQCSAETIRQMVKRGELRGFRVGRMIRIPWDAVEEHECRQSASDGSGADTASTGPARTAPADAIAARDADRARVRREALEEAAAWCRANTMDIAMDVNERVFAGLYCAGKFTADEGRHSGIGYAAAIRAMIDEESK